MAALGSFRPDDVSRGDPRCRRRALSGIIDTMPDMPSISESDLPALHRAANTRSLAGQKQALRLTKLRLGAVVAAAAGGAATWDVGRHHDVRLAAWIAFVAFLTAGACEIALAIRRPDRVWYEGRAAAESVKTLTWRYMMRAESYETEARHVDQRFVREIIEVLDNLATIAAPPAGPTDGQITTKMRDVRGLAFNDPRHVYLERRIREQQAWYSNKATSNATLGRYWIDASVLLEVAGMIGAALKAVDVIDFDFLGIFATAAAAAGAWAQAKQYQNLSTAYGVTSQELAAIASEIEVLTDESMWALFVAEAEEAISREHTLWRASRGVRVRPRRN